MTVPLRSLALPLLYGVMLAAHHAARPHPVHVSNTDVDLARDGRTLEITVRIFTDDLEEAITPSGQAVTARFGTAPAPVLDSLLRRYLRDRLRITLDQAPAAAPTLLGHDRAEDATQVFLELPASAHPTRIRVLQRVLLDRYDDQTNLVHVTVGTVKRSALLRRGQDEADLRF